MDKQNFLIEGCYDNVIGFDLREFHSQCSVPSKYHMENGIQYSIYDSDFNGTKIFFSDGISPSFQVIEKHGKNYLLGENSCYPCSIVYSNQLGNKYVCVFVLPSNNIIQCTTDPSISSVIFNFHAIKYYELIKDYDIYSTFLDLFINSFQGNEWYSSVYLIVLIKRNRSLGIDNIILTLKERKLLSPIELALLSVFYGYEIDSKELYHSILGKKDIPLGITYLTPPGFRLNIAQSTVHLIDTEEFKNVIFSFSRDEIEDFFELTFIKNAVSIINPNSQILCDILSVDDPNYWNEKKLRLETLNINLSLIENYYKKLIKNIRYLENSLRTKSGFNVVGGLYNESLLFTLLTKSLPQYKILSQHNPSWLGKQRFDIFIEPLNIAIEYNGRQHYEAVNYFGGKEGLIQTQKRDQLKRDKCSQHNCLLIEIKYDENINDATEKILNLVKLTSLSMFG